MAFVKVAKLSELQEGEPKGLEVKDTRFLLLKLDGKVYAMNSVCSHAGGPLEDGIYEDGCIVCPWHKSRFDAKSGDVVEGPADTPQQMYKVDLSGEDILVDL